MVLASIYSLPFVFVLSLLIALMLYAFSSRISPKPSGIGKLSNKLDNYACGEKLTARKFQLNSQRFFLYATFFMIFDVTAFFLALSFTANVVFPLLFCAIISTIVVMMISVVGGNRK